MLPSTHRSPRTSIPATGLGSIVVAAPQLALVADRGVVAPAAVAVAVRDERRGATGRGPWGAADAHGADERAEDGR
jgi:hypothetical protein